MVTPGRPLLVCLKGSCHRPRASTRPARVMNRRQLVMSVSANRTGPTLEGRQHGPRSRLRESDDLSRRSRRPGR